VWPNFLLAWEAELDYHAIRSNPPETLAMIQPFIQPHLF
jgi:hypothetical protein